jgi:hypothetical protein
MKRLTSWMLVVVGACALFLLQPGLVLGKGAPVVTPFTDGGSFTDTSLCGYPIHVRWHEQGRVDEWFDAHGNLIRLVVHHVFSEVDRANGKVATGIDREKLTSDEQDTYTQPGSWIFYLPDGSHIQTAGRITATLNTGRRPRSTGHIQSPTDNSRLCSASRWPERFG